MIRQLNSDNIINTQYVGTDYNCTDILTKALPTSSFERHRTTIMGPQGDAPHRCNRKIEGCVGEIWVTSILPHSPNSAQLKKLCYLVFYLSAHSLTLLSCGYRTTLSSYHASWGSLTGRPGG